MLDLATIMLFARSLDALDVPLPPAAQLVLDLRVAALEAANASPADDLAGALADGTLTPENVGEWLLQAALTANAQDKAHVLLRDLQMPLVRRFAQAVRDDADRLLRDLRKAFTPPANVMQTAGRLFPATATAEQVLAAGAEAAAAWRELEQARRTLDEVHSARVTLARDYGIAPAIPEVLMFTRGIGNGLAAAQADEAWNNPGNAVGGSWHALTAAGFTLHLASAAEITKTQATIAAAEQSRAELERQAAVDQVRKQTPRHLYPEPAPTA